MLSQTHRCPLTPSTYVRNLLLVHALEGPSGWHGIIAHTRETRDETRDERRREELRRTAYGVGAGWLASRLAHRECKCECEVASGIQRTRSGGTLRVNRRKQPREAGKLRSRVSAVRGPQKLLAGGAAFTSRRVRPGLLPVFHQRRHGADYGVVTK
ncbi:hypothetical protein NDU88_004601 [Pleurodeles waltl]|uniref:Uncharacterized protein n=1 Tax=Pleurodeles waltl TaxID=8319 RepID=A0AAV7VGR5_PLEWA|nr:hypothetical protein NDU88_004601 [Pleurodeles waltl]